MDPAWQKDYPAPNTNRTLDLNFSALCNTNVSPADPSIDVGPNHVIQMINGASESYFKVFNKSGGQLVGANLLRHLFGQPGGAGDPIAVYDGLADRWLMSEFTANGNTFKTDLWKQSACRCAHVRAPCATK